MGRFLVGAPAMAVAGGRASGRSLLPRPQRRFISGVAMVPGANPHAYIFWWLVFQPGSLFLAGRDSPVLRIARAMFRQQRLPYRAGGRRGPGLEPQHKMARTDASVPGRELASQSSRAPRFRASRMELASA